MLALTNKNVPVFKNRNYYDNNDYYKEINEIFKKRDENNTLREKKAQKAAFEARKREQQVKTDSFEKIKTSFNNHSEKTRKKRGINIPLLFAAALTSTGIIITSATLQNTDKNNSDLNITVNTNADDDAEELYLDFDEQTKSAQEIKTIENAVNTIKDDIELKKAYYDMLVTIQRLRKNIDDPVNTIKDILSQPWAKGLDIEYILAQIFMESSGNHYIESGEINTSDTGCVGLMQLSKNAQTDANALYFPDDPQDRNDPLGNLKLGIAYNKFIMDNYFENDLFNTLCAYNAGITNILNGNYKNSDEYALNILKYREILQAHPNYTQMLLNGDLDEYMDEFAY